MLLAMVVLLFGGPRLISIIWYLLDQARWAATFPDGFLLPLLGFLFLPWTLVMYVLVGPVVDGGEWVLIGLGLLADALSYGGGAAQTRRYGYKATA
jgi:hypothetical protein